ncbi:hypothetical protein Tsubulata_012256 [Turnera subulata]|uniref:MRN complex-interacting protein N-terminal domain-containing protein n=1 Tax=Turnera subulata TaxID=218843 RepID=A0A9Q0GET1_9ROSI|nr:hypothetical protein Tsubulata_012256 [Turnera subulata]
MPIVFIAVQCCQCSTMQVKQQKKSGNKWTCVVCNQKQSVRKLYAQGYMAKDLRKFVQSFNMSRSLSSDQHQHSPAPVLDDPGSSSTGFERKRRTDWTEYLDLEEDHLRPLGDGGK